MNIESNHFSGLFAFKLFAVNTSFIFLNIELMAMMKEFLQLVFLLLNAVVSIISIMAMIKRGLLDFLSVKRGKENAEQSDVKSDG